MKITSLDKIRELAVSHNPKIKKKVMIPPGEAGELVYFSQAYFPAGEVVPAHTHEDMGEMFLVQSGKGEILINDQSFQFIPGVCVLVEPGESHEIRNTGDEMLVVTYMGIK
ncbi:MAG: cupin domain-containing protein [Gammaproteobacteria bacterium]|nr:MAG: cupin domain-containing protein [Gammaproteobacteria bacterium]